MKNHFSNSLKKRSSFLILILIFVSCNSIFSVKTLDNTNDSKFKIIFVADVRVASNKAWLERVATDWGATGICLRIFWGHLDTDSKPGSDHWENLDKAITTITSSEFNQKKLDIYIRVCMGLQKPSWVSPSNSRFVRDDFQIKYDNTIYNHQDYEKGIPDSEKHPLNFNSPNSQKFMQDFLREVLEHINKSYPDSIKSRIREVVPTFSTSDEEEYPFSAMCGYSSFENENFINYLKIKYEDNLASLNKQWNPENDFRNLNSWLEISPSKYEWQTYSNSDYTYPNGRVDWMNFRTKQLANFINSLSEIIHGHGFKMGVQLGSIYDDLIERRGWIDPTILFEKTNAIHVADIFQYSENFDFGSEYLSSICKFWTYTNKYSDISIRFSTETNWPNFYGKDPEFLSFYWKKQLVTYFEQGASEHYLVGWDITPEKLDRLKLQFDPWRKVLIEYSDKEIVKKDNKEAIHLGVEQVFYNHNKKSVWNKTFAMSEFISNVNQNLLIEVFAKNNYDFVTNYMLTKNPEYIMNYKSIYFSEENGYMTLKAYKQLIELLRKESIVVNGLDELSEPNSDLVFYKNEYGDFYKKLPDKINLSK